MALALEHRFEPFSQGRGFITQERVDEIETMLHGMGSISHRFTMPTDNWRTNLMPGGMVERISPWAKDQVELSNLLFEIGWED